jgi:type III secretory pathway component EscS
MIDRTMEPALSESERAFVARAISRRRLFLALSLSGLVIGAMLSLHYGARKLQDPSFPVGAKVVILVLILLNSRQNLRQYRFAGILEKIRPRTNP